MSWSTSTRTIIQDALAYAYLGSTNTADFLTYLCRIDRSSGNYAHQMALAVQFAKVRAAVNDQAPHISDWLNYCYAPDVASINKTIKQAHIADIVTQEVFNGSYSYKRLGRLSIVAYMAVEDYRVGMIMGRELPVSSYVEAIGTHPASWARDWEPHRRKALMKIKSFDIDGVAVVSKVVKAIRKSEK